MKFAERLRLLGHPTYEAYLQSAHWKQFKKAYETSGASVRCAACGSSHFQLHHRTYERLGQELIGDVVPLCETHHEAVHKWLAYRGLPVERTYEAISAVCGIVRPKKKRKKKAAPELPRVTSRDVRSRLAAARADFERLKRAKK